MKRLFILFVLIFFMFSCNKDYEFLGEYLLGSLVNTNPYSGTETLVFQSSEGKEVLFLGNGRSRTKHEAVAYRNNYTEDTYEYETDECKFSETNGKYEFKIHMKSSYDFICTMVILFYPSKSTNYSSCVYSSWYDLPLLKDNLKSDQFYIDSLLVLDKYYYNVIGAKVDNRYCSNGTLSKYIYYNITHGILKIDLPDNSSLEFKKIM